MLRDLRGDGGGEEAMAECLVAYGKYHFDNGEREKAKRDFVQAMEIRSSVRPNFIISIFSLFSRKRSIFG